MNKTFKTGAQILVVVAAVAVLATAAFAYTNPTGTAPSGNVPAPVNTGTFMQTKLGDLGLAGTGTGNLFATMNGWFGGGVFAKTGYFGTDSSSVSATTNILSAMTSLLGKGLVVDQSGSPTVHNAIFTVDLRGNSGSTGRNAIDVEASSDNTHAVLSTNMPGFHLWSNAISGGSDAGILAGYGFFKGLVTIQDGTQGAGKVLTSDADGNASWNAFQTDSTNGLITYVRVDGTGQDTAVCPSGYVAIGGGGDCQDLMTISQPDPAGNGVQATGWKVVCGTPNIASGGSGHFNSGGAVHAEAICMKSTTLLTSLNNGTNNPTTTTSTTTTTTTPTTNWHLLTDRVASPTTASNGTSCDTWLAANGVGTVTHRGVAVNPIAGNVQNPTNATSGTCAYQFSSRVVAVAGVTAGAPVPSTQLNLLEFGTTCAIAPSSSSFTNGHPVTACHDSYASGNTGPLFGTGSQATTQLSYVSATAPTPIHTYQWQVASGQPSATVGAAACMSWLGVASNETGVFNTSACSVLSTGGTNSCIYDIGLNGSSLAGSIKPSTYYVNYSSTSNNYLAPVQKINAEVDSNFDYAGSAPLGTANRTCMYK